MNIKYASTDSDLAIVKLDPLTKPLREVRIGQTNRKRNDRRDSGSYRQSFGL